MTQSVHRLLVLAGVFALVVTRLLPPWETCWHVDGSACATPESTPCCDGDEPADPTPHEPCSDCSDLTVFAAVKNDPRADIHPAGQLLAVAGPENVRRLPDPFSPPPASCHGPPIGPPLSLSMPLLC